MSLKYTSIRIVVCRDATLTKFIFLYLGTMKKIITSAILVGALSLSSLSNAFAGGFDPYYYGQWGSSELQFMIDSIKDEKLKELITKNILTITANTVVEDYDYNSKHFFTKKLTANIVIPDEIKAKAKKVYLSFNTSEGPMVYDSIKAPEVVPTTTTDEKNHIQINIDLSKTTGELNIDTEDFAKYITNDFGTSFVGMAYVEFEDGVKIPFSNAVYLYLPKNNVEWKKSHLMNLYYQSTQYTGMANTQELLQKVFAKLQKKLGSTAKYIAVLEAAMVKVDEKLKKIEATQNANVESIKTEDDFAGKVASHGLLIEKYNLLNDIKYQLWTEVKTKQSQDVIEEIFGSDAN